MHKLLCVPRDKRTRREEEQNPSSHPQLGGSLHLAVPQLLKGQDGGGGVLHTPVRQMLFR